MSILRASGALRRSTRLASLPLTPRRHRSTSNSFFRVSDEVQEALNAKKPIVALETTIYTHGFPYPDNIALASQMESIVRVNGGVPATIGILDGVARVGLDPEEIIRLSAAAGKQDTLKVSRRDLAYACGTRLTDKAYIGGTTISGTMILAHLAGIKVFATGGLGGVHRGAESSMDISADLTELGRTPVTVISSGCKGFLDIPRTLEYLETQGVGVGTFADGRKENIDFPAFWSRDSGFKSPLVIENEIQAAAIIHVQASFPVNSGLLFANPIPEEYSIPKEEMDVIIAEALKKAPPGKDNTPYVLNKLKELSGSKSIAANRELIASNVRRGTIVARELAILESGQDRAEVGTTPSFAPMSKAQSNFFTVPAPTAAESPSPSPSTQILDTPRPAYVVVAGALAVDFACDYAPLVDSLLETAISPQLHTSNPSTVTQSLGGVAHNIAKAAHLVGGNVQLCSAVGNDLSGRAAIAQLTEEGIRTDGIETLSDANKSRTSQYVAVNDAHKDLMLAMADMSILESLTHSDLDKIWLQPLQSHPPKAVVADGNWSSSSLHSWLRTGKKINALTIFEPVSTAKGIRLLTPPKDQGPLPIFPNHICDIATPNIHELQTLHLKASELDLFSDPKWWPTIDSLGIPSSGIRVPLSITTSPSLVDEGIPQQAIRLLPFIPSIITKLGAKGVLLTMLLPNNDERLNDPKEAKYVLARCGNGSQEVGGLYVRFFEPEEVLGVGEVVSVNGAGDTLVGTLVAGLGAGKRVEECVSMAIRAAGCTLRSREAVSPELKNLGKYWMK